jgi:predicted thioesterase
MKVTLTVEVEVEPEKDLNAKEQSNVTGMMVRVARNRLTALVGQRLGGDHQSVGWEVSVSNVDVSAASKLK